jgi:hypothetical protein
MADLGAVGDGFNQYGSYLGYLGLFYTSTDKDIDRWEQDLREYATYPGNGKSAAALFINTIWRSFCLVGKLEEGDGSAAAFCSSSSSHILKTACAE